VRGQHETIAGTLEVEEASIEAERLSVSEEAHELASAKDELFALSNKAQLGLQRAQHQEDEASQLEARAEAARREIEELEARAREQGAAIEELDGQLARVEEEAEASQQVYAAKQAEHDGLRAGLADARRALDEAVAELAAARARIARNEAERAAAEQRRDDLAGRLDGIAAEEATAAERVAALAATDETLRESLTVLRARSDERKARREDAAVRQGALRADVSRGELELETLREEAHRRRSRLASLTEIQDRYESFQKGVRAIMQHREALSASDASASGIRGVVADIVQPPPELETAVEAVLGERLGNIIVESHEVGLEAIEFLKQKSEGRSSFIPVGLRAPVPIPAMVAAPAGEVVYDATGGAVVEGSDAPPVFMTPIDTSIWPKGDGVRGPLLDLIGYDRQYDRIATYLLGDVVVVENLRRALELWRETQTSKTIVTLEGEVIDPQGVVTGGARESAVAGVLEQKREIRELEEVVAKLETDTQAALERHVGKKQDLALVTEELERLATELRADELELFGQQKDLDRANEELRRFEARRAQLEAQAGDLRRAREDAEGRAERAAEALAADAAVVEGADARSGELRARTTELGAEVDAVVVELTTLKVAAAQAADRRQNALLTLERLRRERVEHEARAERLAQSIADETARAGELRVEAARMRDEALLQQAEAEARARAHGERQDALEERQTRLAQRDAELRVTRADAARLSQTQGKLELRYQEASLRRSSLEETVTDRYRDVVLPAIVQDYHLRPLFGEVEEQRAKELRGLIERMGEINLTAIEESEELQARFDFLTTQKADLESAISQLEAAIEKINRASRKRFRETFEAVNAKFKEVFPRLFGGGHAHLALTDEGDLLETGVEIIANPPGKKVSQNIELLSGGEKALTAVSLLFAIFLIKPSPFCVLDEVDAPLDEANVGRFNQAVREMTDRSQFIIITHNRRTMEIADRLCGITMEEPGVSKLVAVNLKAGGGKVGRAKVETAASAPAQA
jgi:chromosome segregation protein